MNKTFLIIVHFGSVADTYACLRSIYSIPKAPPVILVNNSLEPDLKTKTKQFDQVELITPEENLGFAKANNLGMKKALEMGGRFLILLNNDTLVPPDFCKNLIGYASSSGSAHVISPKIYFAKGFEFHKNSYLKEDFGRIFWYAGGLIDWNNVYAFHRGVDEVDHGQYERIEETDFATGCAMLIKKEVVEKIGFLDENYFLYFEDVDYSLTAKKNGFIVNYYPHAFIWHKNAASSQGPGSLLHQYYQTRNRLFFGFKFANFRIKFALIRESFRFMFQGGIKRKAVLDFYARRMGKADL